QDLESKPESLLQGPSPQELSLQESSSSLQELSSREQSPWERSSQELLFKELLSWEPSL
ncbi:21433_t:CDS:1, partial [Dentiscutata erythropus]